MLDNRLGVHLILQLGRTVPVPAPAPLLAALVRAQVVNDASGSDGFQLAFSLGSSGAPDPLAGGALDVMNRVRIGVSTGALPQMLIDGVITNHETASGGGSIMLFVTGRDVSLSLDLEERNASYENQSDSVIVSQILGQYPDLALVPKVTRTSAAPTVNQRIPRQAETDLKFIRRLAERNGFVFYVEPETFGVSNAYFGPPERGPRQPELYFDGGPRDNVSALRGTTDALAPIDVMATYLDTASSNKAQHAIPPDRQDAAPPLARGAISAQRKVLHRSAGPLTEGLVGSTAAARIANAPDPVVVQGTVDILRYGAVLRPRGVVHLAGAGPAYDGDYRVRRVDHRLERGTYTQSFTLGREGTGALGKAAP